VVEAMPRRVQRDEAASAGVEFRAVGQHAVGGRHPVEGPGQHGRAGQVAQPRRARVVVGVAVRHEDSVDPAMRRAHVRYLYQVSLVIRPWVDHDAARGRTIDHVAVRARPGHERRVRRQDHLDALGYFHSLLCPIHSWR